MLRRRKFGAVDEDDLEDEDDEEAVEIEKARLSGGRGCSCCGSQGSS